MWKTFLGLVIRTFGFLFLSSSTFQITYICIRDFSIYSIYCCSSCQYYLLIWEQSQNEAGSSVFPCFIERKCLTPNYPFLKVFRKEEIPWNKFPKQLWGIIRIKEPESNRNHTLNNSHYHSAPRFLPALLIDHISPLDPDKGVKNCSQHKALGIYFQLTVVLSCWILL